MSDGGWYEQFYADLKRLVTLARSAGPKRKPSTLKEVSDLNERMTAAYHERGFLFSDGGD